MSEPNEEIKKWITKADHDLGTALPTSCRKIFKIFFNTSPNQF